MTRNNGDCVPDNIAEDIYVAGQRVAAGVYRLVGSQREVCLEVDDVLPATCDGHVATYVRGAATWADISIPKRDRALIG